MNDHSSPTANFEELKQTYSTFASKASISLMIFLVYSVIQLFRFGNKDDYLIILLGSVFSICAIFVYVYVALWYKKGEKGWLPAFLSFGGIIPWAFCCYLVFFDGFWNLRFLFSEFQWLVLIKSVIFIFFGYKALKNFWKITEIDRAIREKNIKIS